MCKQLDLLGIENNEDGVYSVIKANSLDKVRDLAKRQFKGDEQSEIFDELNRVEKMISSTKSDYRNEPAKISMNLSKRDFRIIIDMRHGGDDDIIIIIIVVVVVK